MVRGATSALVLALAWACVARASVLVPTYVLPPESFVRDQRSLGRPQDADAGESQRTIKRLIGGHMKIKSEKDHGSPKNSIVVDDKSEGGKFAGVIAPELSGSTVGWNQGIWDDGMLMSSAGEGKDAGKMKEDDEDKKTLSDQVAEGKYGLIQDELFSKTPKRPGIVSYQPNSETRAKDNLQNLGGLKKEEIWLAEDHLLVIKGGSFPERTKESEQKIWPPIDNYEAPRRQVKLPHKPKVPPPFPVQLSDDGPLVFLTPNGSVPAAVFPPFPAGEGESPLYPPSFLFPPGAFDAQGYNQGNASAGGAPMPNPPFPFLPGNASEGPMNGSFPEGFPPGAAFLPPPSNQTDLYDEDDPSIYYPPPYNFSYRADFDSKVPAGPLVPGIILPPPPDFFAPLEEKTTTEEVSTTSRSKAYSRTKVDPKPPVTTPSYRNKLKSRLTTTDPTTTTEQFTTVTTPEDVETTTKYRKTQRIVTSSPRNQVKVHNLPEQVSTRPKVEKPVYKTRAKLTSKPLSVSVFYDYPEQTYERKPTTSEKPYVLYNVPANAINSIAKDVSSTSVPVKYYTNVQNDEVPTTKLQPIYNQKPSEDGLASFYFFDEQPKSSAAPDNYYDNRNYYNTNQQAYVPKQRVNPQNSFSPASYSSISQADALFLWPQKQGPHTLTQEYFSIQKPRQNVYVQQPKQRPNSFYQQIADIQQTIDLFTTKKPKSHRPYNTKPKPLPGRPVYQFNFETQPRPDKFTFRAPKLDPEPFRPMVSYSKPFNAENEFNTASPSYQPEYQQYLVENVQVTTESPTSSRYYPKNKPREEDYEDVAIGKAVPVQSNRNHIPVQTGKPVQQVNRYPSTTPNPISNGYYTKHDERYLDDITKNSFDVFGQKLEDGGLAGVTPPIGTVKTPIDNDINIKYAYEYENTRNPPSLAKDTEVNDRFPRPHINPLSESIYAGNPSAPLIQRPNPPSLLHDTRVNDRLPRPTINPDSEFIPIPNPNFKPYQYRIAAPLQAPPEASELYDLNAPSLAGDTDVNYRRPLPTPNPDAEWIGAYGAGEGRPGSLVSYRLPGDGAHVYFVTPQAAHAHAHAHNSRQSYRPPGYGR
ncbi:uncharacterized protein LOC121726029 [Aricia agestis]|uniref:uncharacterized protein LOC121726029 n=1 Tax=Aricia agestis TaxID=91739 RepID=UPI001C206ED8|nr:uncharacterized protein LOC121726029 [Aricia agestis]